MKKEVVLAITIGFILGLIITFGIWTAQNSLKQLPAGPTPTPLLTSVTSDSDTAASPTPAGSASTGMTLSLSSPEDETLSNNNKVTVSGKTSAGAVVALIFETGEKIIQADNTGSFSTEIALEGGYNFISVTAYDAAGNTASDNVVVTYTTVRI